MVETTVKDT